MTRPGTPADVIAGTLARLAATGVPVAGVPAQLPASLFPKPERPKLTDADRRALGEAITSGSLCRCCAGVHAGGELACPRLATFELDRDGRLTAGGYWPDGGWDASRVVFAEEQTPPPPEPVPNGKPDYEKIAGMEAETGVGAGG